MTFLGRTPVLPPVGIYPEIPRPWCVPGGEWKMLLKHPVIRVTEDGTIICGPSGFGSNGTSIHSILPIDREGPWSTESIPHDAGYALQIGFRLEQETLIRVPLTRQMVDDAWVQGHTHKRHTEPAGKGITCIHAAGIRTFGFAAWNKYQRDLHSLKHAGEISVLVMRAEAEVWDFLTRGVKSLEDSHGFAVV